jgi:hypothetical protein
VLAFFRVLRALCAMTEADHALAGEP